MYRVTLHTDHPEHDRIEFDLREEPPEGFDFQCKQPTFYHKWWLAHKSYWDLKPSEISSYEIEERPERPVTRYTEFVVSGKEGQFLNVIADTATEAIERFENMQMTAYPKGPTPYITSVSLVEKESEG